MRELAYLLAAQRDLNDILRHIARQSGSRLVGESFVGRLRQQCRRLAALPGALGHPRPELAADLRSFPCHGYVIFFRYAESRLEVVNVIERHRDMDALFDDASQTRPP